MGYPNNAAEFRELCDAMREKGAIQAFGIILGPQPAKTLPANASPEEIRAAKREERIEAARQAIRDRLGRDDLPNERIDQYIDPQVFES